MSDRKKTLQEALAEVQRNAELKRIEENKAMWNNASELGEGLSGLWSSLGKMGRGAKPKKPINPMPHGGEKLTPETPKGRQGPETIDLKANKPSAPTSTTPAAPSKAGKIASNMMGAVLGAGAGTIVGDKLANKLKGDTTSAAPTSDTTPPSQPTSVTPTQEPAKPEAPKQTFGQAFAAARKAAAEKGAKSTGQFEYQGKKFQTNVKGEKYVPMAKQTKVDIGTKVSVPSSTKPETPETPPTPLTKQSTGDSYVNREPGWRDTLPQPAPSKPLVGEPPSSGSFRGSIKDTTPIGPNPTKFTKPETESGGKRKKMSEESNSLISAFLKLQETKAANMFEAAKKMSSKEKSLASLGHPKDKITQKDVLIGRGVLPRDVDEANIDPVITGSKSVTSSPKGYVDPSTPTKPYQKAPISTKAGEIISKAKGAAGMKEETVEEGIADVVKTGTQVAKNFAANVRKGYSGSTGNVTRNITPVTTKTATRPVGSTFAKPGGASKAGEAVGSFAKSANALADKPVAATIGASALGGAAILGASTPKFTKPDTSSAAPAPAPKPAAPVGGTMSAPTPKPAAPSASVPLPPKRPLEVGKSFGQTFSAARQKAGGAAGEFEYKGKSYSTRMKGEKPVAPLKKVEEEALFSEEELNYFNSVIETVSIAPSDSGETVSNTVSDTSPRRTLTDGKKVK